MQDRVKLQSDIDRAKDMSGAVNLASFARRGQKTALLFGAGYTALALIPHLKAQGYHIVATVRDAKKRAALQAAGLEAITFDPENMDAVLYHLKRAHIILSSAGPNRLSSSRPTSRQTSGQAPPIDIDPILSAVRRASKKSFKALAPKLRWAGYLSATSVYGDRGGRWAFEDERLYPGTKRGRARVEAELAWLETGWPVHVFRLAGIYGPELRIGSHVIERNPLSRLKRGAARLVIKPAHIVNRIHVEDIARAVLASIAQPNPARVYNIADGAPAPPQDVLRFGARLIGIETPPQIAHDDPALSPMAQSFYKESKAVDISRARRELGFNPAYRDYRYGLLSLMNPDKRGQGQQGQQQMWLAGHITVPERQLEKTLSLLPAHIEATRAEAGCLRFDVTQDGENPSRLHVVEAFRSIADFEAHQRRLQSSPWFDVSRHFIRDYVTSGV